MKYFAVLKTLIMHTRIKIGDTHFLYLNQKFFIAFADRT